MKISIIIPVYNISSYIYQCLESVINQTYKNIEIIIVDDGSTDFSGVICSSFAKKDKRIKLIRKQNEGLAEARKTGIKSSTGEYIFNLDGDDWISKECIKDFVDSIEENDTDIVINSFYKEFVGEIHHVKNHFQEGFYDENKIKKIILPELISSKNYFSHGISTYLWGKLFKKDLLIGHQLSVPSEFSVGEDAVVTFPYIADCKSLTIIDKPNYFYRQRAQSMLKTINKNKQELKYIESLTNYLSSRLTGFDFNQQISEYKYNLAMIRTGCFFNNRNLFDTFEIEFPTNKNIGIYSTGSFGQQVYFRIDEMPDINVIWFDDDHNESKIFGLEVQDPRDINKMNLDILLIASVNEKYCVDLKEKLEHLGFPANKVIYPAQIEEKKI